MRNELVDKVVAKMAQSLSPQQLYELRQSLDAELSAYELTPITDNVEKSKQNNVALMVNFISAKRIEGCSEKTLNYYENTIKAFLDSVGKPLGEISTNEIRCYLSDFQAKRNAGKVTVDNVRRILSSFFSWLEDEDYIVKSPVRRIHKVRSELTVKETISDEHLEHLRDTCTEVRDLALIDFLVSTGVRVGELVTLNRSDIDFNERQCIVLGKGNKERTVYFNARAKVHLQNYLATRSDDNEALFVSLAAPHNRLTISGVESRVRQLGKAANICRIHPHKFRRTLATMAIDKGMPIEQVQRLLGHCKIDTTLHYAMVNQTNVRNAHRKYIG
ncbi:MAG: tyrosine-type recombinase/integrase [Muribaculaceae bacterium]|nr:tyrosine-type recombinase/integrase [Muribaculaceae bacterium]